MAVSGKSSELLKAEAHIWNQTFSFKNSACLKCAVQLGIADAIEKHGKPMSLSELTSTLPIHPSKSPYLYRLMRILVYSGFFTDGITGYALTPAARLLLQDEPLNARDLVLMVLDPVMVKPWNALSDWFQNSIDDEKEAPFDTAHSKNFWEYNAEEPRLRKLFNDAMASDSNLITKVLMQDCKFVFEGLTSLVDVGGGTGTVARAIVKAFPMLHCTVFDLPHVVANQVSMKNLDFVAGDMLEKIPSANSILLKVRFSFP